jgi:hypothetical protein
MRGGEVGGEEEGEEGGKDAAGRREDETPEVMRPSLRKKSVIGNYADVDAALDADTIAAQQQASKAFGCCKEYVRRKASDALLEQQTPVGSSRSLLSTPTGSGRQLKLGVSSRGIIITAPDDEDGGSDDELARQIGDTNSKKSLTKISFASDNPMALMSAAGSVGGVVLPDERDITISPISASPTIMSRSGIGSQSRNSPGDNDPGPGPVHFLETFELAALDTAAGRADINQVRFIV